MTEYPNERRQWKAWHDGLQALQSTLLYPASLLPSQDREKAILMVRYRQSHQFSSRKEYQAYMDYVFTVGQPFEMTLKEGFHCGESVFNYKERVYAMDLSLLDQMTWMDKDRMQTPLTHFRKRDSSSSEHKKSFNYWLERGGQYRDAFLRRRQKEKAFQTFAEKDFQRLTLNKVPEYNGEGTMDQLREQTLYFGYPLACYATVKGDLFYTVEVTWSKEVAEELNFDSLISKDALYFDNPLNFSGQFGRDMDVFCVLNEERQDQDYVTFQEVSAVDEHYLRQDLFTENKELQATLCVRDDELSALRKDIDKLTLKLYAHQEIPERQLESTLSKDTQNALQMLKSFQFAFDTLSQKRLEHDRKPLSLADRLIVLHEVTLHQGDFLESITGRAIDQASDDLKDRVFAGFQNALSIAQSAEDSEAGLQFAASRLPEALKQIVNNYEEHEEKSVQEDVATQDVATQDVATQNVATQDVATQDAVTQNVADKDVVDNAVINRVTETCDVDTEQLRQTIATMKKKARPVVSSIVGNASVMHDQEDQLVLSDEGKVQYSDPKKLEGPYIFYDDLPSSYQDELERNQVTLPEYSPYIPLQKVDEKQYMIDYNQLRRLEEMYEEATPSTLGDDQITIDWLDDSEKKDQTNEMSL